MPPQVKQALSLRTVHSLIRSPPSSIASSASKTSTSTAAPVRSFSQAQPLRSESHESHYDPPSGWLWGIPPGQKPAKEGWENIWAWGFFGSLGVATIAYAFKPDTSIETWALEEAKRRLQAEGTLPEDED